jgi:hypothetical protein
VVIRIVAVATILAVVLLYLYYMAIRLDRLHRRVDVAAAALDAQLKRRSATAAVFAARVPLPPEVALALSTAAADAAVAHGLGHGREAVENLLSRALVVVAAASPEVFTAPTDAGTEMHDEALRATFARRFHNDAVRDALVVRERRLVRWLRLAGSAPHPAYFEMDDEELPSARFELAGRPS